MKNFTLIAFVLVICVSVWGMVIWNMVQENEVANNDLLIEEYEEEEEIEVVLILSTSERFHKQGITRDDAKVIAPEGVIPVDDLLDIIQEK